MALQVTLIGYHYILLDDETSEAAGVVSDLTKAGVHLLAFSEFPHSPGKSQVDLIPEDTSKLEAAARDLGLPLSAKKSGFLIEGDRDPGAVAAILEKLAREQIKVTALQAISNGLGKFGALLWVKPLDVEAAAMVLRATVEDTVDEASEESFPASDAPAWAMRERA